MKRVGGGLVGLLIWIAAVALPVVALPATACAAEGARAVLVVDTGEGVQRYCVALPDDEVSGLELIVLAGEQHGLSYRFGYGGGAVCMLAGVGTTGDDCFEQYPDFWGYWRGSSGGWTWSSTGAGNTSVHDGDVEGWSWGSGSDGSSHRRPPATTFGSVCPVAASPNQEPERSRPGSTGASKEGKSAAPKQAAASRPIAVPRTAAEAVDAPVASRERRKDRPAKGKTGHDRRRPTSTTSKLEPPDLEAEPAAAVAPEETDPSGMPPATGLVALGAAALLGGAGFVLARRRRGDP